MTIMMVLEVTRWTIVGCVAFKVSHEDASVDVLLDLLSYLVEEDFEFAFWDMARCDSTCSTMSLFFAPKNATKISRFLGHVTLKTLVGLSNEATFTLF